MTFTSLLIAIVIAAIAVFILSSIIHMALTYHRSNFSKIANEAAFRDANRALNIAPGEYMFPFAGSPKLMDTEEYKQKLEQGPVGIMTILPNALWPMGKSLAQWFVYCVLVGVFVAYVLLQANIGNNFMEIFRFTSTVAFIGYGLALIQNSIWYFRKWSTTAKFLFDAFVYALTTGAVFAWWLA